MGQHGENPRKSVFAVIPARYGSQRLPGKMMLEIGGKPLVVRTAERVSAASRVEDVIVATDDQRIAQAVESAGFRAALTSIKHRSGSDRVAEVAEDLPKGSIIVNVQGDEPLIDPAAIDRAISALVEDERADISTICEQFRSPTEVLDPSAVKVVVGQSGYAIYFSRQPIPYPRDPSLANGNNLLAALESIPELIRIFRKHIGVYIYRREYLLRFASLPPTATEQIEMLEQLRALEDGARIRVVESDGYTIGIDTYEDLERLRVQLEFDNGM